MKNGKRRTFESSALRKEPGTGAGQRVRQRKQHSTAHTRHVCGEGSGKEPGDEKQADEAVCAAGESAVDVCEHEGDAGPLQETDV